MVIFYSVFKVNGQGCCFDGECNVHVIEAIHGYPEYGRGVKKFEYATVFEGMVGTVDEFKWPVKLVMVKESNKRGRRIDRG